ncbi:MAG: hypothetical protein V7746_08395 [Halioglobus sp.]
MTTTDHNQPEQDAPESVSHIGYPQPFADLALTLCEASNRELRIVSPALDHVVFDKRELAEALSALARRRSNSRIRILINDSRAMVSHGHQLLTLARRLPSSMSIRKLAHHPDMKGETILLGDNSHLLFMPAELDGGYYHPGSRASAQPYIDRFDDLWERATEDPEFRQLGL